MATEKRKRGCNYTPYEKETLLEIIKGHISVVENKATNGLVLKQKQKTWMAIAQQYNAIATSGPRTWAQLRHLYENLKQKTKKNVAAENRQQFYEKENLNLLKSKAANDKKQIMQTGGGKYTTVLTENDNLMLAMVAPQIKPLQNPFDDAAIYFGDVVELASESINEEPCTSNVEPMNTNQINPMEIVCPTFVGNNEAEDAIEIETTHTVPIDNEQGNTLKTKKKGTTHNVSIERRRLISRKKKTNKINLKEKYFKTKLINAQLERKFMIERQKLEIKLLKMKIEKLRDQ